MQSHTLYVLLHLVPTLRRALRAVLRAACNAVAPYRISVYANGDAYEWGSHYAHSRAAALAWVAQYPAGCRAVVWNRRWQVVATRATA